MDGLLHIILLSLAAESWYLLEILIFCQVRREKINERMKLLQELVPGCNKVLENAEFTFYFIFRYVKVV